jgi:lysophospholipase L1-like esterase
MRTNAIARMLGPIALSATLLALGLAASGQSYEGGAATRPEPRQENFWTELHEKFLDRAKRGHIDLLFLGDSITQGWNDNEVWRRYYGPRHAANFGIGGDRTQHVLWRLDNGEAEGYTPGVVVVMIGTNNIGSNTSAEIAEGNRAILDRIHSRWPEAKVLLLGVFPRGTSADRANKDQAAASLDPRTGEINALLEKLGERDDVTYLDIGKVFLDDEDHIPRDIMPDFLHLSPEGYRRWAEAIEPTLWEMSH